MPIKQKKSLDLITKSRLSNGGDGEIRITAKA
jgi:hypothetical protein